MSRLLADLEVKAIKTAAYLLNHTLTESLRFKTPLRCLYEYLKRELPQPIGAHLRLYGCRAYPVILDQPKLDYIEPRARIGYLVGYVSTNIFRIWVP